MGFVFAFRHDITPDLELHLSALLADHVHLPDFAARTLPECLLDVVSGFGGLSVRHFGPAYCFPTVTRPWPEVACVSPTENKQLHQQLGSMAAHLDLVQPVIAKVIDGQIASTRQTVRAAGRLVEAGVETRPEWHSRGHGTAVVLGWALKCLQTGRVPLYSTSWDNAASMALARHLNLIHYATELSIS